MTFEQKELSGSLFKNSKKERDNQPDVRGSAKIAGVDYRVSGWNKTTKDGAPWISLSFTRADADPRRQEPTETIMPQTSGERQSAESAVRDMPDDVPF